MSHLHPELSAPGPLPKGGLRVTALGGLGEVTEMLGRQVGDIGDAEAQVR